MSEADRPQIIKPQDVVRMRVGVKHRIQVMDLRADGLLAKIRSGVDQNVAAAILDKYRRP